MSAMLRLRRLVVSDRWFFITCRLLPRRRTLSELAFACLGRVIHNPDRGLPCSNAKSSDE